MRKELNRSYLNGPTRKASTLPAGPLETEIEISKRHKSEMSAFCAERRESGIPDFTMDAAFWAFSSRQKDEWKDWRKLSTNGQTAITDEEVTNEDGTVQKVRTADRPGRVCLDCKTALPAPQGRGRPAVRCESCRATKPTPKSDKSDKPGVVPSVRICRDCDAPLPAPQGRGRPATRCEKCRGI
jgi:hypothetical protein